MNKNWTTEAEARQQIKELVAAYYHNTHLLTPFP